MLVSTFLFDGCHEDTLLHLKCTLEDEGVDLWILQENTYNLKGEYKGVYAQEVLKQERFKPYLHKIQVVSADVNPLVGSEEHQNFMREGWQRTLGYELLEQCPDDTLILVSDVDEMVDFSNRGRYDRFFQGVLQDRVTFCRRRRAWFDFDNECFLKDIRVPIIPLKIVLGNPSALPQTRHYHDESRTFGSYNDSIIYEYSYCFSQDGINKKKTNYSHTGFTPECVEGALKLNCWPRAKSRGEKIDWNGNDLFETMILTEENSPQYVREHLAELKTNVVDPNYKENRKNWKLDYTG
jgi:hypothetical protein